MDLGALASGCDVSSLTEEAQITSSLSVIDGRLAFKDQHSFQVYMKQLFTKKNTIDKTINGFTSLKASLAANTNLGAQTLSLGEIPMSDQFQSVLNSKGEFQVASSVYVVSGGIVSEYEASGYQSNGLSKRSGQIKREAQILATKGCESPIYTYPGTTELYKMKGLAFNTDYLIYREAGAKTYWEKSRKRLFGGTDWDTSSGRLNHVFVSVSGMVQAFSPDGTPIPRFVMPDAGSDTDTDGEVTKLGYYDWTGGSNFGVSMTTQHSAHLVNGISLSCSNSYEDS